MNEICYLSLCELVTLLRTRRLSAREVMSAHLEQIHCWNPHLNAIVAQLSDEICLARADEADTRGAHADSLGPLHGLPWAQI